MCIAVGNVSFEDWLRLTSSFGWTSREPSVPPRSSVARFAITSLTFMFVWVPLPVCHTTSGKWSSRRPSITSSAAATMARALSSGQEPEVAVHQRARLLEDAERADHLAGESLAPDPEVLERALGLGAPVAVGGDLDRPHGVALGPGRSGPRAISRGRLHRRSFGAGRPAPQPSDGQAAAALASVGVRIQDNIQAHDPPGSERALERRPEAARILDGLPHPAQRLRDAIVAGERAATSRPSARARRRSAGPIGSCPSRRRCRRRRPGAGRSAPRSRAPCRSARTRRPPRGAAPTTPD